MMLGKIVVSTGLVLNMLGAALLAWDLILTKTEALELTRHYFPDAGESSHEIRRLLQVKESLRVSRNAQFGLALIVIGLCGQLAGLWLSW
ncbi:MAG TPA: hypothetical protein VET84_03105 [Stellaceae bacterium]|nr:hypothetical protein [Stellaceae bacterium]